MNRLPLLAAASAILLSSPALAKDERLVSRLFKADEVVRIDGRINVQASIVFDENEHIENVAIGDSNAWQVTPNKRANMLFIKPLSARARTNMTVVTDRHTYVFDLVAQGSGTPLYVLRFTYPEEPKAKAGQQLADAGLTTEEQQALSSEPGTAPVDPASLNFAWGKKGDAALLPARVYDDGNATYLAWPVGAPIPAIQIENQRGTEGPVNYAVRGDVIVVEGVPDTIILRSGKDKATLRFAGERRTREAPALPAELAAAANAAPVSTKGS